MKAILSAKVRLAAAILSAVALANVGGGLAARHLLAGEAPPVPAAEELKFVEKPTATKAGDKVKIHFSVSREADVAVFVEDAGGKVIRHLVAGVLGKNPPPPLKANSLEQSVEWDGKADWGKPAGAGPFKVRVALGLAAKYDKQIVADTQSIGDVQAMVAGPDGTLYVVAGAGARVPNWGSQRLIALGRDGTYERTLIPPPSTTTREQFAALGGAAVEVGGHPVPVCMNIRARTFTAFGIAAASGLAVTPDGQILTLHDDGTMGMLDAVAGKQTVVYHGPKLLPKEPKSSFRSGVRAFVAVSSDGKSAYFSGIAARRSWSALNERTPPYPAVFKVKLPERTPAVPFFGDVARAGNDETHLGALVWGSNPHRPRAPGVRGLAVDGKGTLLVCDRGNNRIVAVNEGDGKFAGALSVESPEMVQVDRQTGAVYVMRLLGRTAELVKFTGWKDGKQVATAQYPAGWDEPKWVMALDASARPPVVWLSQNRKLMRIEDRGEKFSNAKVVGTGTVGDGGFVDLTVDRYRDDPEVYARCWRTGWLRFNERTGKTDQVRLPVHGSAGSCIEPGPDGNLYTLGWPQFLFKWDRNGKPLQWDVPFKVPEGVRPYSRPTNAIYVPVCMVYMTHTHGIRGDGHHFIFQRRPGARDRDTKALYEYAPSGARIGGPIIWKASDAVIGPQFDQQGNIYVAEQVRPLDQLVPPEFASYVGPLKLGARFGHRDPRGNPPQMYGSIIKFSPKGGMIDWPGLRHDKMGSSNPFEGRPKLDLSLNVMELASCMGRDERFYCAAKVIGAEWVHFGISHLELFYCNCENTRFDVDLFGRVWYPDLCRFRVGVLDTNGNLIMQFGGYGNAESMGPDSPVIDPQSGKLRARRPDDPPTLKSPFAQPDIAFAWLIGVGVTDRYAYMGDSLNRRLLRARLVYAAEETCAIK